MTTYLTLSDGTRAAYDAWLTSRERFPRAARRSNNGLTYPTRVEVVLVGPFEREGGPHFGERVEGFFTDSRLGLGEHWEKVERVARNMGEQLLAARIRDEGGPHLTILEQFLRTNPYIRNTSR